MNQILYTIEDENRNNRFKSIILFFSIILIIFGLALTGVGGYNIYASNVKKQEKIELAKVPQIELSSMDNQVIVQVEHVRTVKEILYSWNDEEEKKIEVNKMNGIKEYIDIPADTNTLFVKVTDINGTFSKIEKEFSYEGTYMEPYILDSKQLKIVAKDVDGLQSLAYKWNSEEQVMKEAENLDTNLIEITTDIPVGRNTITFIAVNNKNEVTRKEMEVQGITKPTIRVNYNSDRTLFTVKLHDDQGIESYSYKLSYAKLEDVAENGNFKENFQEKLTISKENNIQSNSELDVVDKISLEDGFNFLEVKVKNIEGIEETISGWCVK